jgi:hypothetical protein
MAPIPVGAIVAGAALVVACGVREARAQQCETEAPVRGPVSILILGSPSRVDDFAASVRDGRTLVREAGTVIFDDGRVVTADVDSATRHLNALGWGGRSIQIVASFPVRSAPPPRRRG